MVCNIDEAVMRNKAIAESANPLLLNRKTPCTKMVKCCDCQSPERICCNYDVMGVHLKKECSPVVLVDGVLRF